MRHRHDTANYTAPDVVTTIHPPHEIFQSADSYVEVVDTITGQVVRQADTGVKLTKKGGTKGEVYDEKNHHLWVATTGKEMLVLNPDALAIIKRLP